MPERPSDKTPTKVGPWLRLSSEEVYDNPWIRVKHETVQTPAGTDGIYGLIHFKSMAIGVVPIDKEGNTWLVGQYRYALDDYSWEIPMGGGPLNQDPLLAAQRELKEETGLVANDWRQILQLHTSNSVSDEKAYVYIAENLTQGAQRLEDSESDLVVKKLPLDEAISWALQGKITDAISVAALLFLARETLALRQ